MEDIPGYEGMYKISRDGVVYSLKTNKELKSPVSGRYKILNLRKNGKAKSYRIHVLVAMTYLNHKQDGFKLLVDHINNNPLDNRVENLQLVSNRINCIKDNKKVSKYTPFLGVQWVPERSKYKAQISIDGARKSLGHYKCHALAHIAYVKKLNEICY